MFWGKYRNVQKFLHSNRKRSYKSVVTSSYKIKTIDSARSMATLLSILLENLTERSHKIQCKDFDSFLEYESVKESSIKYNRLSCNKNYSNKFNEELKKKEIQKNI